MAELAQRFGVEKAALTGLVDRAERRGFVSRSPAAGDRRALDVTLTSSGRRAAAAFHADASAELDQLLSPLSPSDRGNFRTALGTIIAAHCSGAAIMLLTATMSWLIKAIRKLVNRRMASRTSTTFGM